MSDGWESIRLDDLDAVPLFHGLVWRPIRRRLGIRSFGINAYQSESRGQLVVEEHDETSGGAGGHEELYLVLRGRASFTVGGETTDAPAGTLLVIRDPTLKRVATAEEDDTLVLAVGGEPDRPFAVSAWEAVFAALPALRAERWEEAIATLGEGLEAHPGNPSLLYNLACAESRAGRSEEALAHLRAAITKDATYLEAARNEPDFEPLRDAPNFPGG